MPTLDSRRPSCWLLVVLGRRGQDGMREVWGGRGGGLSSGSLGSGASGLVTTIYCFLKRLS